MAWRKAGPEGTKAGAFIAYFEERVVGGIAVRSPTVGRSAVVGETTLAPDWLRAARMPSETQPEQALRTKVLGIWIEEKHSKFVVGVELREPEGVVA